VDLTPSWWDPESVGEQYLYLYVHNVTEPSQRWDLVLSFYFLAENEVKTMKTPQNTH
jgi:hypothetical protein